MPVTSEIEGASVENGRPVSEPPFRLAVFTTHPVQYHVPLFRALAARPELEPTVLYASRHGLNVSMDRGFGTAFQWDVPLVDGYEHRFLENRARNPDVSTFRGVDVPAVRREIVAERFDGVLVLGWQTYGHLQAMRAARAAGVPLLIRGESHLRVRPVSTWKTLARSALWLPVRELVYRRMFSSVDAFLPIGSLNREFYRHFGVPERKFFHAPYCVDNGNFALDEPLRGAARARIRDRLGVGAETVVFTSAGKLIARKCPLDILEAFEAVAARGLDVHLLYLGDGPERARLEAEIERRGLAGRVSISGFVNQSALAEWYAASDCTVLASLAETWGLVVNEAMAAGLPVLVSDVAGCAPDLVREGENGFTFPTGDPAALAERMEKIALRPAASRAAMGARSAEIIADYTVENAAAAVSAAVAAVAGAR